jgi:hypothetical protein
LGATIYKIGESVKDFYEAVDPYIDAYEDILGPTAQSGESITNALSGGLFESLTGVASQAVGVFAESLKKLVIQQHDWYQHLQNSMSSGADEQTWFWADILHSRKTFEFAKNLWAMAGSDQERAYAIGYMTHLATDVVGHSFVNDKVGGPWRLHWQRHHIVEEQMDAAVYSREHSSDPLYFSVCSSAQHLWIAFDDDGTTTPPSHQNFFDPSERPQFDPSDGAALVSSTVLYVLRIQKSRKFHTPTQMTHLVNLPHIPRF